MERVADCARNDGCDAALAAGFTANNVVDSSASQLLNDGSCAPDVGALDVKKGCFSRSKLDGSNSSCRASSAGDTIGDNVSESFSHSSNEEIRGEETFQEVTATAHAGEGLFVEHHHNSNHVKKNDVRVHPTLLLNPDRLVFDKKSHWRLCGQRDGRDECGDEYDENDKSHVTNHSSRACTAAITAAGEDALTRDDDVFLVSTLICFKDLFQADGSHTSGAPDEHTERPHVDKSVGGVRPDAATGSQRQMSHGHADGSDAKESDANATVGHDKDEGHDVTAEVAVLATHTSDDGCHADPKTTAAPASSSSSGSSSSLYLRHPVSRHNAIPSNEGSVICTRHADPDEDCNHRAEEDVMAGRQRQSLGAPLRCLPLTRTDFCLPIRSRSTPTARTRTAAAAAAAPSTQTLTQTETHTLESPSLQQEAAVSWPWPSDTAAPEGWCGDNEENEELMHHRTQEHRVGEHPLPHTPHPCARNLCRQ